MACSPCITRTLNTVISGRFQTCPKLLHGPSGVQRVAGLWTDVYNEFRPEVYEYIDADPWVVRDTRWFGTSKGTHGPVDIREADAFEVKEGKIVRAIMGYLDETALKPWGWRSRQRATAIFHFRDGRVVRVVNYMDADRALADLGLEE
jgi:ketosteroid isomerase-like protein